MMAPGLGGGQVQSVNEWLCGSEARIRYVAVGGKERTPRWLDHPINNPGWVRLTEPGHRRQGVQNVAHGPQANHEQAVLGLGVQISIFSQGYTGCGVVETTSEPAHGGVQLLDFDGKAGGEKGKLEKRGDLCCQPDAIFGGGDKGRGAGGTGG